MADGFSSWFKTPTTSHPCPNCGSDNKKYDHFSWTGGQVGSMMLHEFRCKECDQAFNGKTGMPITFKDRAIVIGKITAFCFVAIALAIGAGKLSELFL